MARKPKIAPPSNCTDETYIEYAAKIRAAELDMQESAIVSKAAAAIYRNICKAADKAGVDIKSLLWGIQAARRDEADIKKEITGRARVSVILGLPIGHQWGLYEEPIADLDPALSQRVKTEKAKIDGMTAGRKLRDREENPYTAGTEEYAAWDEAWMDGNQAAHAKKDKPKPVRAAKAAVGSDGPEMGGAAEGEETWMCGLGMEHVGTRADDDYLEKMRDMGLKAFADGKKLEDMPKNMAPACVAHWQFGYSQGASMGESITGTKAA